MNEKSDISIVRSSTVLYGSLSAIGIAIVFFAHGKLTEIFDFGSEKEQWIKQLAIGLSAGGILLLTSEILNSYSVSYRQFKRDVEKILGPTSFIGGIYLAVLSGFGEEIFFRAALQPWLGLWFTSIIFGLLHLSPGLKISSWTLWAAFSGLLLGWLFERTGSIWVPIYAHIFVNGVSIQRLRYSFRKRIAPKNKKEEF